MPFLNVSKRIEKYKYEMITETVRIKMYYLYKKRKKRRINGKLCQNIKYELNENLAKMKISRE